MRRLHDRSSDVCQYRPRIELLESRCLLSATVVGRYLFYDNSKFEGNQPGVSPLDDAVIATDKVAYLPGGTQASAANVSAYHHGINGVMVDITGSHPNLTSDDFVFRVTNLAGPGWVDAPAPSQLIVRPGAGLDGADRVEIVWPSGSITNRWLKVVTRAGEDTGLTTSDTFLFGSRIGDAFQSAGGANFITNANDSVGARMHSGIDGGLNNIYDFDKNGLVNASDEITARINTGITAGLALDYDPPTITAVLQTDTAHGNSTNNDGITRDWTIRINVTSPNGAALLRFRGLGNTGEVSVVADGSDIYFGEWLDGPPQVLPDGSYSLDLEVIDQLFQNAISRVDFTLKTSVAKPQVPDLIAADDTGFSSVDNFTSVAAPRIDVFAEQGSRATLFVDGLRVGAINSISAAGGQIQLPTLAPGVHSLHVESEDVAGNESSSDPLTLTIDTMAPTISLTSLVTVSNDVTPHLTVELAGIGEVVVPIDVDLNYDGDFTDPGERNYSRVPVSGGEAFFQLTPALPLADSLGNAYYVRLRARVSDNAGNEGVSIPVSLRIDTAGSSVLEDYVSAFDPSYSYTVVDTQDFGNYKSYMLNMTSQTWRSAAEVSRPTWQHWVEIIVPDGPVSSTALLFVTGGSTRDVQPPADSQMGVAAVLMKSVVVKLPTVPNQAISFPGGPSDATEDAIIAYTFDKFIDNLGAPGNQTWPALLPMVKSAKAAMDAAQSFVPTVIGGQQIEDFIVSGQSKRGWTTWLTGAVDDRVRAIIPGVIDVLNLDEQMVNHYGYYGNFSFALGDYTGYGIPQNAFSTGMQELGRIVDPYSYFHNGRYDDMPKLIVNSSGDEFFVPTSSELYFSDIPGTDNYLRYIPNTGHGLDSTAIFSAIAFFDAVANNLPLPEFTWQMGQDGSITVDVDTVPTEVRVWRATNPSSREFRHELVPGIIWQSTLITPGSDGKYRASPIVTTGSQAFFIELTYPSGSTGISHKFTTQVSVVDSLPVFNWPFFMPVNPAPAPLPGLPPSQEVGDSLEPKQADAVAFSLTASNELASAAPAAAPQVLAAPSGVNLPNPSAAIAIALWELATDESDLSPADPEEHNSLSFDADWLDELVLL